MRAPQLSLWVLILYIYDVKNIRLIEKEFTIINCEYNYGNVLKDKKRSFIKEMVWLIIGNLGIKVELSI